MDDDDFLVPDIDDDDEDMPLVIENNQEPYEAHEVPQEDQVEDRVEDPEGDDAGESDGDQGEEEEDEVQHDEVHDPHRLQDGLKDQEDDEDEELSGCDPDETYYPFPSLPGFVSKRYQRLSAFQDWFDTRSDGSLKMADQAADPTSPLAFPVVAKFAQKCVRQTSSELGNDVYVIILGFEEQRPTSGNFYTVFYDGARALEHMANVGDDDEVYPYPSLSFAGRVLYGSNCNGWHAFRVCDPDSPHHDKRLASLRRSAGGPGFVNTFNRALLEKWDNLATRVCSQQSVQYLTAFGEALAQLQAAADDVEEGEDHDVEDDDEQEVEDEDDVEDDEDDEDEEDVEEPTNSLIHPNTVIRRAKLPPPSNAVILPDFKKRPRDGVMFDSTASKVARLDDEDN
uniref:Uncharacterized protein n=1 Tax=viral metagenome TaxID=1070528 RepID=A0A6C0BMB9_9ZZZZ